jgi:hypothetical protein
VLVECPECKGQGTIGPLYSAAKKVLDAYAVFLEHDDDTDGLEVLRLALTELQEAL